VSLQDFLQTSVEIRILLVESWVFNLKGDSLNSGERDRCFFEPLNQEVCEKALHPINNHRFIDAPVFDDVVDRLIFARVCDSRVRQVMMMDYLEKWGQRMFHDFLNGYITQNFSFFFDVEGFEEMNVYRILWKQSDFGPLFAQSNAKLNCFTLS